MHKLTKNAQVFEWSEDCQKAFDQFKQIFTTAFFAFPNYQLPFFLFVDASAYGLGATLGQQQPNGCDAVIAYGARKLIPRERNFSATEREALAVLDGIKRYRHYPISFLPERFESHFKTKSFAFKSLSSGSRASNSRESSSVPKWGKVVEGPNVFSGAKERQLQTNGFCFF